MKLVESLKRGVAVVYQNTWHYGLPGLFQQYFKLLSKKQNMVCWFAFKSLLKSKRGILALQYECLVLGCEVRCATDRERKQHLVKAHRYPMSFEFHRKRLDTRKIVSWKRCVASFKQGFGRVRKIYLLSSQH